MQDFRVGRSVGRVVSLWRYPVKSMAAEELAEADVSWHGFAGDRRWAFVRDAAPQCGFPWLTLRQRGDLNHYRPSFVEPARPDTSPTVVRTPSGEIFDVTDRALAEELGPGARVIRHHRGIFDTFPLSLITTQTIARLGEIVGTSLDVQRFRPNLLVEAADHHAAFVEDGWVGNVLLIGGLRLRVDKRDGRCVVITIDPLTAERDPAIFGPVARDRQGQLGVYGTTVELGRVRVGDPVLMEPGCNDTRCHALERAAARSAPRGRAQSPK